MAQKPRTTYRQAKLSLLQEIGRAGDQSRQRLITALVDSNDLQARGVFSEALEALLQDQFLIVTEKGYGLTHPGEQALETACLDPVDLALHGVDPELVEARARCWYAVATRSPDRLAAALEDICLLRQACVLVGASGKISVFKPALQLIEATEQRARVSLTEAGAPTRQQMADLIRIIEILIRETLLRSGD